MCPVPGPLPPPTPGTVRDGQMDGHGRSQKKRCEGVPGKVSGPRRWGRVLQHRSWVVSLFQTHLKVVLEGQDAGVATLPL